MNESPESGRKGKPWFFIGITGGIILGAMFENVGAGVAIGICLWLVMGLIENKSKRRGSRTV